MKLVDMPAYQVAALMNDCQNFCFYGGVAVGKTAVGSHFAILHMKQYPHLSGFIGANTYDQLSHVALAEIMYWLDYYNMPYVQDRRPPREWGTKGFKPRKHYKNILSVLVDDWVVTIHTRVMSKPHNLRGMEFSWAWIDELRDTKEEAFDEVLKRMRESDYMKTLVTTTTNGDSWDAKRFFTNGDGKLYGSMHVPTIESLKAGLITKKYYEGLRSSFSPLVAAQELDAMHVNVLGGRAYYSGNKDNARYRAPWGAVEPDPRYPLIVGCDFNFSPAPCVWVIGQVGPMLKHKKTGKVFDWTKHIHWFDEIKLVEAGTIAMTETLMARYPGFYYRIYGDASGNRGTTSNAGETDYNQITQTLADAGAQYEIDVDQSNPLVKNRVENMCRMLRDAAGNVRMTYNPDRCPLLHGDINHVGWKRIVGQGGRGKLDDGGDSNRTHASDAVGYALWKLFPPGRRLELVQSVASHNMTRLIQSLETGGSYE
jgi:hypothetical protein